VGSATFPAASTAVDLSAVSTVGQSLGVQSNFGVDEVYATIVIEKVA
jgi:hypothetical protein